jgi:drug/metabolite transporter (DMT)-like permease
MAYFARRGAVPLTRNDWAMVLLLGFVGYYLSSLLSFLALNYIPASLERLLLYLTPTFVFVISALLLKQRIKRHHVIALILTYGGIVLVLGDNFVISAEPQAVAIGAALVVASVLTYAVYLIGSGTVIPRFGSARFTAYASGTACGYVIAQFLLIRDISALDLPLPVYAYGATMAIICTVLPTWMMAEGMRRIGASQASLLGAIGPVSTIALAALILDEPITLVQIGGALLVLAGVGLVTYRREAAPITSAAAKN